MTPLAHQLTRKLLRGEGAEAARKFIRGVLDGAHFFEVTEALPLIEEVRNAMTKSDSGPFLPCTFLPAPKTWIEWRTPDNARHAVTLVRGDLVTPFLAPDAPAIPPAASAQALIIYHHSDREGCESIIAGTLLLQSGGDAYLARNNWEAYPEAREQMKYGVEHAVYLLALINSPRIVGRRVHTPHKGLVRELKRAQWRLHPWHEIHLEVTKPRDFDDGETHTDVLTGRRALHFVRKFIRIRLGKLEYVREHWRGDPALGVRRARYVVTAGREQT